MHFFGIRSLKIKIILVTFLFLSTVFFLDKLIFGHLIYKFPNIMEWDTSPWYNFLSKSKSLPKKNESNSTSVLFTGSSVSMYSVNRAEVLKNLSNKNSSSVNSVDFYSHVAMSPTDLRYYIDDILEKKPDLLVYPFVVADFQLDSFTFSEEKSNFSRDKWLRSYAIRTPVTAFYPFQFLKDHLFDLKQSEFFNLLSKSILHINRMRNFVLDPFYTFYDKVYRGGRSYHNYTGIIPDSGVWWRGWARDNFTIQCKISNKNLFSEYIYFPVANATLNIKNKENILFSSMIQKVGWSLIEFPIESKGNEYELTFQVDKTISSKIIDPKSYFKEQIYGIRLSQNFCKDDYEENISYNRFYANEDKILESMTDDEYKTDYSNRLWADLDKRRELDRIQLIRIISEKLSNQNFSRWDEIDNLEIVAKKIANSNTKLILILMPENPLEPKYLQTSPWMKDFLNQINQLSNNKNVFFYDKSSFITKPQYFIDINHLTYKGSELMSKEFSNLILEHINE